MPTRIIRDGILTSERIALLGWAEEVFYRRLMSVADDYGRFYAHPSLLRAACYPLHLSKVSDSDIGKWLTACVTAALVRVYPAQDGKRYLEIQDFGQRVQSKSKFPGPSGEIERVTVDHGESPDVPALVVVGVVDVNEKSIGRPADRFGEFWELYPKKVGKKPTQEKWKAKKLDALADTILADIRNRAKSDRRWLDGYIPNPATYLTQERWQDEIQGNAKPPSAVPSGKPQGPSETPLERAIAYARQQFAFGQIDADERDRLIADATAKHRGNS